MLKTYELGSDNAAITIVLSDNDCYYLPSINDGGGISNFSPVEPSNSIAAIKCSNIVANSEDEAQVAMAQSILDALNAA